MKDENISYISFLKWVSEILENIPQLPLKTNTYKDLQKSKDSVICLNTNSKDKSSHSTKE